MNEHTEKSVPQATRTSGLEEIARAVEEAIDLVKTKQGDAKLILVGGGSIIIADHIAGVSEILRPKYFEVANAVGAAVSSSFSRLLRETLTYFCLDWKNKRGGG